MPKFFRDPTLNDLMQRMTDLLVLDSQKAIGKRRAQRSNVRATESDRLASVHANQPIPSRPAISRSAVAPAGHRPASIARKRVA